MPVFGVICEYDPFHLGHRWMLEQLRQQGPVVCAMSGCFTQRGEFAAVNKFARAEMAVRNGADLVLELRDMIGEAIEIETFTPEDTDAWNAAYERIKSLIK